MLDLQELELLLDGVQTEGHVVVSLGEAEDRVFQTVSGLRTSVVLSHGGAGRSDQVDSACPLNSRPRGKSPEKKRRRRRNIN